jgi:hypothetical protein
VVPTTSCKLLLPAPRLLLPCKRSADSGAASVGESAAAESADSGAGTGTTKRRIRGVGITDRVAPYQPSAASLLPAGGGGGSQPTPAPARRCKSSMGPEKLVMRTLGADQVVQLVQDPASRAPRPPNIEGDPSAYVGRIFREGAGVRRRRKGWDTWTAKGGGRGGRTLISSCGRSVRQLYGKATLRGHKLTSAAATPKFLVFHMWTVSGTDKRLYHIVSDGRRRQKRVDRTGLLESEVAQSKSEVAQLEDRVRTLETVVALLLESKTPQLNALLNLANPSSTTGSTVSET